MFPILKAEKQKWRRNKQKTVVGTGLQKRQQKNPKKLVASTLVPNLREVASTLFPKTLHVSFQKLVLKSNGFRIVWYALHPVIPGVKECFLARWPQNHTQYPWLVRRWVTKEINNNLAIKEIGIPTSENLPTFDGFKKGPDWNPDPLNVTSFCWP